MLELPTEDTRHLDDACGWLGLGCLVDAGRELEAISPEAQSHPDVLQARWLLCSKLGDWEKCMDLAKTLTQIAPERRFGWIHLALSLHRLGRTEESKDILLCALDMFEPNATMAYFLARYTCRLGHVAEAREWLVRAFELVHEPAQRRQFKQRAAEEPDLEPLREEIEQIRA